MLGKDLSDIFVIFGKVREMNSGGGAVLFFVYGRIIIAGMNIFVDSTILSRGVVLTHINDHK